MRFYRLLLSIALALFLLVVLIAIYFFFSLDQGRQIESQFLVGWSEIKKDYFNFGPKVYQRPVATSTQSDFTPAYLPESPKPEITTGKYLVADLSAMKLTLYANGEIRDILPLATIGKVGTPWETPRGLFQIQTKEQAHFSSIGHVYMPNAMQFNGNYFIHGPTYYPGGAPVGASFSGGCITLNATAAKEVFNFSEIGTPVFVTGGQPDSGQRTGFWMAKNSEQSFTPSASAFLVADLATGQILRSKNLEAILPLGDLSRLLTALVTLDAVNFLQPTTVKVAGTEFPASTLLLPGEKLTSQELLYPLLFGDRGAANASLLKIIGADSFLAKMNKRAAAIGLTHTNFTNVENLADLNNKTTVTDLFFLAQHLFYFKNYLFTVTTKDSVRVGPHTWRNQNNLTDLPGFLGGLIGQSAATTTNQSGLVVLNLPTGDGSVRPVALIVLNSNQVVTDLHRLAAELWQNEVYHRPALK